MATIETSLSNMKKVSYNGQDCNVVHFGDACTWAKPCTVYIPEFDRWGPTDMGGITIKRTSGHCTAGPVGTLVSEGPHYGQYGNNYFGPYMIQCFYGDTIETEITYSSYQLYPQNFTVTSDMTVHYEPYKDGYPGGDDGSITFTVAGKSYSTTEGTTWKDFANSSSDFMYYSTGDYVTTSAGAVGYTNGNMVAGSDTITSGYSYIVVS